MLRPGKVTAPVKGNREEKIGGEKQGREAGFALRFHRLVLRTCQAPTAKPADQSQTRRCNETQKDLRKDKSKIIAVKYRSAGRGLAHRNCDAGI